ncbi:toll/interleukin-1 receptor domain-containing protein [Streptomyces sp. NPDC059340]|uniref:toll/interleukin-1 receptor domain-containing protein n=1 Tax=Streptomyces sp. NPDC059340 TaxID=3346806 RepID=UPI0036C633E4
MTRTTEGGETGSVSPDGPRVFISYAHEAGDGAHADRVRALWILLRRHGIDARLDRPAAERPQDWAAWMQREFEAADHVLTIASPAYKRRAKGAEAPGVGAYETEPAPGSLPQSPPRDARTAPSETERAPVRHNFNGPAAVQIGHHNHRTINFNSAL